MSPTPLWALRRIQQAKAENATKLYLYGDPYSKLTKIPPELFELTQLEKLILQDNNLTILPPTIKALPVLQEIDLIGNPLEKIADVPGLILDFEIWQRLCDNLSPTHITGLYLKVGNSLPRSLFSLPNLTWLSLSDNGLSKLPQGIVQLSQLQYLDLSYNDFRELPYEVVQLSQLQFLALHYNEISELPSEIGKLSHLQDLVLNHNDLSELPPEIGKLTHLQSLHLNRNRFWELPLELVQLTHLQLLDLRENQLHVLPLEINQLKNLQSLSLSENQFHTLPLEITRLTHLQYLDFMNNELNKLPSEIRQLCHLQYLGLSGNHLRELPLEIVQLAHLQSLDLSFNEVSQLPPEIRQLTQLQSLDLSFNEISQLPLEIGQLSQLQSLNLRSNQLHELPPEIGQLPQLQSLDLSENQLHKLPNSIYKLKSLKQLGLGYRGENKAKVNRFQELSSDILHLEKLRELNVYGQPLKIPPPEVVAMAENGKADIAKIRSYFEQLEREGTDYLYEAKLLIVGEAGAGKTSLTRKILNPQAPLPEENESTKGIDIARWSFNDGDNDFYVNLWDFGGQEIYKTTHQFFLTNRSLYILVADNRKQDTDFYYWLNTIELLSNNSPVLILNNKKGGRERPIDVRSLKSRFDNLKDDPLRSNLDTDNTLGDIYPAIEYWIKRLPHIGTPLPKSWMLVRRALQALPDNYIPYKQFLQICEDEGLTNEYFKSNLSEFLHDLGICLHFKDDIRLKKWVILKPTWGTDAVYKVLDNDRVIAQHGRFDDADLAHIWHEEKYVDMQAELLQLMIKFQLCYEIPGQRGAYIAPQRLPDEKADYDWDAEQNLILRYTYRFMPKGIMTRFIVALHPHIDDDQLWKSGVILAKDGTRAEVIEHYTQSPRITVRVVGQNKRGLLELIMDALDTIHASFERLRVDKMVPCNCEQCEGSQKPHAYPFDELKVRILHQKYDIECARPPFEKMNVLRLIDDVIDFKKLVEQDPQLKALLQDKEQAIYQQFNLQGVTNMDVNKQGPTIDINGNNNTIGDIVGGDKTGRDKAGGDIVHGDKAGRDIVKGAPASGDPYAELKIALAEWQAQVLALLEAREDLDEDEKDEMQEEVVENATKVLDEAQDKARPGRIERLLNTVVAMQDDILDVTVATLLNPLAGVKLVLTKIQDRIKLEKANQVQTDATA